METVAKALKKDYPAQRESALSADALVNTINTIRATADNTQDPIIRKTLEASLSLYEGSVKALEQSFKDKLTEVVQMVGGTGCDDPAFAWAQAAQEALRAKLIALKLA